MKRLILLLLPVLFAEVLVAQTKVPTCKPDTTIADTLYGVFPLPYHPVRNPTSGIKDTACLNTYFEYTFTLRIPATFNIPGIGAIPISSVSMHPDTAVRNLPQGLKYACNPPTCVFQANTEGCIILYGTPNNSAQVGRHDLQIRGLVSTAFIPLNISFPDSTFFAPGNYYLYIQPEGSPACKPSSTSELAATRIQMRNIPNPYTDLTEIEVVSELRGRFDFRVYDFSGRVVHREAVQIIQGVNRWTFDGSQLPEGIYIYTLTDGLSSMSRKMVVNR